MLSRLPVNPARAGLSAAPADSPPPPPILPSPESPASLGDLPLQLATKCYNAASAPAIAEVAQLPFDMTVTVAHEPTMGVRLVQGALGPHGGLPDGLASTHRNA